MLKSYKSRITDKYKTPCFVCMYYAPTMRVPSMARILDMVYVMSILTCFAFENGNKSFAIPGLGTGCGKLSAEGCAKAMRAGYDAGMYISS